MEKEVAKDKGIITFDVPATEKANIYTVAVHHEGRYKEDNIVYWMGKIEGIEIPDDTIIEIKMDEIEWEEAEWKPNRGKLYSNEEDTECDETFEIDMDSFESEFLVPSDYNKLGIEFYVKDIFHIGERPTYSDMLVGVRGSNIGTGENENGWRIFTVRHEKSDAEDNVSKGEFQPYIKAESFGFSDVDGYKIPPLVEEEYDIKWE
ncbi:MAG: hypothetical protein ACOC1K_08315 [Nanoarchaeota archaeon]